MGKRKAALGFIFITLMLDVLGFGLLIPVAPKLIQGLLHAGQGGTEAEAAPYVAWLQATFYAMSFLFAPMLGVLSDKVGRRPVILISLFGSGLDYLAMAVSPSLLWLFGTRVINGLTGASFSVASAYVADVTPPEKRAAGYGIIGAAFGVGFVIGPLLGGLLGDPTMKLPIIGHGDIHLPFFVASGLTMVNWVYGWFVLPESLPKERRAPFRLARANPLGSLAAISKYKLVIGMAGALFLFNMSQFGLHSTWVLYTGHRYGWGPEDVGWSLFAVGVGAAVVQGGLSGRVVHAIGERKALLFGLATAVTAYMGYALSTDGWMLYVFIGIASLGAVSQPAAQAMISKTVLPTEQGAVQGALASLQSLAGIFGPLIGGNVLGYFITKPPPFPNSRIDLQGMNYFVSAGLAMMGWVVAWFATKGIKRWVMEHQQAGTPGGEELERETRTGAMISEQRAKAAE